jgi:hypothetical protein
MPDVSLFAEDFGHQAFIQPLLAGRLAEQFGVPVKVQPLSVRGGFATVGRELDEYVREILACRRRLPDAIVVATDGNCTGFRERKKTFDKIVEPIKDRVVFAIPDPHIEKWPLLDPGAFGQIVGVPCETPQHKCERDRYKRFLIDAVRNAGLEPLLGGMEHAEDIVHAMDLKQAAQHDESFGSFLQDMEAKFRLWKESS